jgi:nitrogen fixation protein
MKVVIKTNHSMTIGLWLSDVEAKNIAKAIKSKDRIESVILTNGMELNFRKLVHVAELSIIANASKKFRKVFDGEIDIDDLYKQIA